MIVQDATDLLNELHTKVPLRALDALHLATFLSAEVGPLFTKDKRMLQAAEHLGFALAG
jgi:predicted nucleic acid-binding protein